MTDAPGWIIINTVGRGKACIFAGNVFTILSSTKFDLETARKAAKEELKDQSSTNPTGFKPGETEKVDEHVHVKMVKLTKSILYVRSTEGGQSDVVLRSSERLTTIWSKVKAGLKEIERAIAKEQAREQAKENTN